MSLSASTPAPEVYKAIIAITAKLARTGIAKARIHAEDSYAYRSIDDLCNRLAPLLAQHRLCILPCVLKHKSTPCQDGQGTPLTRVWLKVAFDLISARDGSTHRLEAFGEALDADDKATAKAMTSAYKQAMLQTFCIPVQGGEQTAGPKSIVATGGEVVDPDQGWEQWSRDIEDMIGSCESEEALGRVQNRYHSLLRAASKRRPDLFGMIGASLAKRRSALRSASASKQLPRSTPAKVLTDA